MPVQVDFTEPRVLPTRLSENMEGWRIVMVRILEDNQPFVFLRNFSTHYPAIILGLTSGELSVMTFSQRWSTWEDMDKPTGVKSVIFKG